MRRKFRGSALVMLIAVTGCSSETPPEPTPSPTDSQTMTPTPTFSPEEIAVDAMTTEERAASVVMGHIPSTDPEEVGDYMRSGLGGFILMGSNVEGDQEQLQALTEGLIVDEDLPPLIAIDQEGGDVSRLPWDDLPGGRQLQGSDPEDVQNTFEDRANLVVDAGANVNLGIVADVPADSADFIASRALGADPPSSAANVQAAVTGEQGVVFSTLKHFPGHGAAPGDSHFELPSTDLSLELWREADAVPFAAGVDAGAELLMFGHLVFSSVDDAPASLSERWHDIARSELGFEGVCITDDLGMLLSAGDDEYQDPVQNAVRAIDAGSDMVLMIAGSTPETAGDMAAGIAEAVENGTLSEERLREAAIRVMSLRLQLAG
ncbi:glycoside hydrolase family 3 N-terminal domain-containing protein [uncultured Agrococcus sp.]|uniref:glycoside hydrolase family 3 N-terminal domain-containing protein n=1 Tax=uncultured Agrococcus sp. TaxID=382258 RepID=UPI0025FF442C|nr:glycoside hydrolase family 3 N-terminal domain-containing protein [uncultured Agrococcus sp.]